LGCENAEDDEIAEAVVRGEPVMADSKMKGGAL
jgi:hypothetical protein